MSDNPFASPAQNPGKAPVMGGVYQGPVKAPTVISAITIIALILGAFGLLGSCTTIGGFFVAKQMTSMFEDMAEENPQMQAQLELQRAQEPYLLPAMVIGIVNFFLASGLLIGSIMTLMRKPLGPSLLSKCFVVAILFCFARLIFTIVQQFMMKDAMLEAMQQGPNPEFAGQIMEGSFWFGVIFGVVMALVLIGFYVFGTMKFGSDEGKRYFATFK